MDRFIIVITESRYLGMMGIPYLASNENSTSLALTEQVNTANYEKNDYSFSPQEIEIIKVLHKISEKYIFKVFSKEKTLRLFLDKMDQKFYADSVRPHIDKNLSKCFNLLAELPQLEVYFKDAKYSNVYLSDNIKVNPSFTEPVFHFYLNNEDLDYSLRIKQEGEDMEITHKSPLIITHQPCCMIIHENLYRFEHINSKKFTPFFDKKAIKIPARSVPTYMETFVLNSLRDHHVKTQGFNISDDEVKPSAILSLEQDLAQSQILVLKYKYGSRDYMASSVSKVYIELDKKETSYEFRRLRRQYDWEKDIVSAIEKYGLKKLDGANFLPKNTDKENPTIRLHQILAWLSENQKLLERLQIEVNQDELDQKYYIGHYSHHIKPTEDKDWFDLRIHITIGEFKIPFIKFRKHILNHRPEYVLPNGQIFLIPDEWFSKYAEVFHFAKIEGDKVTISKKYFAIIGDPNKYSSDNKLSFNANEHKNGAPETLKAKLRPYQLEGYHWIKHLNQNDFGGILADDMGLGKTIQTISLLLSVYSEQNKEPQPKPSLPPQTQLNLFESSHLEGFNSSKNSASLIVMPTSLVHNWHNEFMKFSPSLKIYNYTGAKRLRSKEIGNILRHYHVVITSYGVLRNDIEYLKPFGFHYVILDESQYIKNPSSKIYEAIMQVDCKHRLALTGTPIENSLIDLWAQMNFVNPTLLGSLNFFKKYFSTPISKFQDEKKEAKLLQLIQPFILRRTKDKVAKDLPPISEQVYYCDLPEDHKSIYEQEKSGIRNQLLQAIERNGIEKSSIMALQALTRLRLLANHPVLVEEDYTGQSGKLNVVMDTLDNIVTEKHKVLIFSSFVKDLELIEKELNNKKYKYSKLTGSTKDRAQVVDAFESDDDCQIFLISLKAGGVGLNLTSADYVFILNPWWNPAAELQAINRAHRIGQTKNVFVYRFISSGTIEEKIQKLQAQKSELANTFIHSNSPFKNMKQADVDDLFE
ncbi:DEAD/DEAH box helicase [bacterium]|nr:DEAD/DEAH box helicase [bacterium]